MEVTTLNIAPYPLLLNTAIETMFAKYVSAAAMYEIALCFLLAAAMIVVITFIFLLRKKRKFFFREGLRQSLESWITQVILGDTLEKADAFTIPEQFKKLLFNTTARTLMIEELVRHKKTFSGTVASNIVRLYYQLGLNVDSIIKLNSNQTHIKCQGIHELYVMEQNSELRKVYKLTNSKNKDVRGEAQTAIVQWFGFNGLRFLDFISYPLTEFQQMQLLEFLRTIKFPGLPRLSQWLQSKNDTVVIFALKLGEHYKQTHVHDEVAACLLHQNEAVRLQAVKTLAKIACPTTAGLIINIYPTESFSNRLNILDKLKYIATKNEVPFLLKQLDNNNDLIKVAAASALAKSTSEGWELLQLKSFEQPQVYKNIYLHVKSLLKK